METRKKAQAAVGMSFNMIFSIILIIVFIALAVYGILYFLKIGRCTQIGSFVADLQEAVDDVWKTSTAKSYIFKDHPLPSSIEYICFADFDKPRDTDKKEIFNVIRRYEESGTLFFYPPRKACDFPFYDLKHINVTAITQESNPYCIRNTGKLEIKLSKDFYEALVCIGDDCGDNNKGSLLVNFKICKKAKDENTCNWLDTSYWEGYRQECCSKHSLCC